METSKRGDSMTCEELKNKILNKSVDDSLLILVYKDNTFVVHQYINQIRLDKNLDIVYVDAVEDIPLDANDFFGTAIGVLYVMHTDKLECSEKLLNYKNTIIVCKEVTEQESCKNNIVVFDKLTKEQVLEYMRLTCPDIPENKLEWLYDIASGDIFRIDSEIQKLKLFPGIQSDIFEMIKEEQGYSDLNQSTIFSCINAFINKDKKALSNILQHLDIIDVEATGLVTLLIRNLKNTILVQGNPSATPESLKMKPQQFYMTKKNCGTFSEKQLVDMFEFLTDIDYRLKSGLLELDNNEFVGYILTNLMEKW